MEEGVRGRERRRMLSARRPSVSVRVCMRGVQKQAAVAAFASSVVNQCGCGANDTILALVSP